MFNKKLVWYKMFDNIEAAKQQVQLGKVRTLEINSKKICLAHISEGFFAVNDKCPHNGASLGNGYCTEQGSVVCPMHRYHFDLKTGRAKSGLGDFVQCYPIKVNNDGVFIGFEESAWSLFRITIYC